MITSPTVAIGIALVIALGLVVFGVIRLVKYFHEENRRDNDFKESPFALDPAKKQH